MLYLQIRKILIEFHFENPPRVVTICTFATTVEPACKVHGCKVFLGVRSIFGWSQSKSDIIGHPDVRSARLYGQFSLDKTLTLQAGATVLMSRADTLGYILVVVQLI